VRCEKLRRKPAAAPDSESRHRADRSNQRHCHGQRKRSGASRRGVDAGLTKLGDVNGGLGLVFATLRLTTALSTYTLLPERLDTFLSLPELDPDETAIET